MLTDAQRDHLGGMTRTLQIIVGAMAFGALMFAAAIIVVSSNLPNLGGGRQPPILTYAGAAAAFAALVTSWILPSALTAAVRRRIADGKPVVPAYVAQHRTESDELRDVVPLAGAYQTLLIIRSAILEGTAFLCLMFYMIEKQTLSLVAAGVLVAFLLSQFPTRSWVEDWVNGELATIEQLRQMRLVDAR